MNIVRALQPALTLALLLAMLTTVLLTSIALSPGHTTPWHVFAVIIHNH